MTELAVRVSKLSHHYVSAGSEQHVLSDVDLQVEQGESVALLGASGSGKSTLLNLIGGLEPIQSGEVQVFGQSLSTLDDETRTLMRRDRVGFVHQAFNLIPTLNVADNISLPLALAGVTAEQRAARATTLLRAVGLDGRERQWPDRLSGGEQQRVAIARALAAEPRLVLADEPTGNLDAANGERVLDVLAELVDHHRATLLIVTHSLEVAGRMDRACALRAHGIEAVDTTSTRSAGAW